MDIALRLEDLYHELLLEKCKGEEERQWENARHRVMQESIRDSCNYYGMRNCSKEYEERER